MPGQTPDRSHGSPRSDDGSSELDDTVRRRAYLLVPVLLTVVLGRGLVINGFGLPYWQVASPVLIVLLAAMLVGVWRRWLPLGSFEHALLGMVAIGLLGYLITWRVAPSYMAVDAMDIFLTMLWSGLAFPLAFLVLGTRRGLQASLAFYAAMVSLAVPPMSTGRQGQAQLDAATIHVSLAVFFAVMIAMLWVLASRMEALAMARTQASLLAVQAGTDTLTGMPNRRQLDVQLDRDIARARRHGEPLSVLLVDIDHFKAVNDRHGHLAGDHVLRELASRLSDTVRGSDLAGRWGGEEFLVIATTTGPEAALELAERCRAAIAAGPVADVGKVTASFGVATLTESDDASSLVQRADAALYRAKAGGRDAVAGTRHPGSTTSPSASLA